MAEIIADNEFRTLKRFVHKIVEQVFDGQDIDGGDLQDWAVEAGILAPTNVEAPCDPEACRCAEWGDFPTTCYRYTERWKGTV